MQDKKDLFVVGTAQIDYYQENRRNTVDKLYTSERVTLEKLLPQVATVTDIGCLFGDLSEVVTSFGAKYTGIDFDEAAISHAKETYPDSTFYCADFLDPNFSIDKSELVLALNVFDHFKDWKAVLRTYRRLTSRYINFSTNMRLHGSTVLDQDLSFLHYSKQKRLLWVVHNVFELAAYCATSNIDACSIYIYAYHKFRTDNWEKAARSVQPIDPADHLTGNIMLEIDESRSMSQTKIRPDLTIVVDGKTVFDSPWKK